MERHEVLVVGAGNAGVSLAAKLLKDGARDVAVVDRRQVHRYRPLLNYVGSGEATTADLERAQHEVLPSAATWVRDDVASVDPGARTVTLGGGRTLGYGTLVLATGLPEDWDAVPGLRAAYDAGWAGSTFVDTSAVRVWPALRDLARGTVVFTIPPEPAPCGATALKPLLMACEHWQRAGVLANLDVRLVTPFDSVLDVPQADERLEPILASYGVQVHHASRVATVDAANRSLTLSTPDGEETLDDVAFAHVVPPYRAPRWVEDAGLGTGPAGLVDVDPETLRHHRHPDVWALGDVANHGTRSSGGALRDQVKVLAHNLAAVHNAGGPAADAELHRYDGYTVMPITTSRQRLLLVEVDREGRSSPSAPFVDLTRPRRSTWLFDRYGLLQVYYRRILRGRV
ncbi:NAD(P)/FAD-dependent oxidoreductase [Nocardioides sp. HDW12B]|nr:NAD(P)/FAD-dependent oxidoreductase [Nocardioides sp. HDW12B]